MTWLIVLAGFMAIFGVIGYLRGWRAALFVLILTLLAVAITGRLGPVIIRYINAFGKGFQFLLSGGLNALAGTGDANQAIQALQGAAPLVAQTDSALVLGLLFVVVVLLGVLLSGLPWFKGSRSVFGLFLGLVAGYTVAAMVVRALTPEFAALAPLPFGFAAPAPTTAVPLVIQPGAPSPSLSARILAFLTGLADRGLIAAFLGIVIAIFLLLATGFGSRSTKKG